MCTNTHTHTHTHTHLCSSGTTITGAHAVARHICRLAWGAESNMSLYGITNLEKAEIDHWLEFSLTSLSQQQQSSLLTSSLDHLEAVLGPRTYLVGYDLSLADLAVYSSLRGKRYL